MFPLTDVLDSDYDLNTKSIVVLYRFFHGLSAETKAHSMVSLMQQLLVIHIAKV